MCNAYLLIALFFCHFLADFTQLSRPWMLKAKATGAADYRIMSHALVHAFLMAGVLLFYCSTWGMVIPLFAFQAITHFWIDVFKGRMNVWFPKVKDQLHYPYWILFGFDQFLHATVIIIIADMAGRTHLNHHQ